MSYYYYKSIYKYLIGFSYLFRNVYIERTNSDGEIVKNFKVPLIVSHKEKSYMSLINNLKTSAAVLPAISIFLSDMQYDEGRQMNPLVSKKEISKYDESILKILKNPSPWNFTFTLTVWSKYEEDMWKNISIGTVA